VTNAQGGGGREDVGCEREKKQLRSAKKKESTAEWV
jgi:hypothetical protein